MPDEPDRDYQTASFPHAHVIRLEDDIAVEELIAFAPDLEEEIYAANLTLASGLATYKAAVISCATVCYAPRAVMGSTLEGLIGLNPDAVIVSPGAQEPPRRTPRRAPPDPPAPVPDWVKDRTEVGIVGLTHVCAALPSGFAVERDDEGHWWVRSDENTVLVRHCPYCGVDLVSGPGEAQGAVAAPVAPPEAVVPRAAVAMSMKLNSGPPDFQTAEISLHVSGIEAATPDDAIEAAIAKGKVGYDAIKKAVYERSKQILAEWTEGRWSR